MTHINTIINKIYELKKLREYQGRAIIVGINGIDCSGKTKLAHELKNQLDKKKYKNQIISIDDFHMPKSYRYDGGDCSPDNYYRRSFNLSKIIDEILNPVFERNAINKEIKLLNLDTDKFTVIKSYNIDQETIVIFEGVFLFRKELINYLDLKIYIDISFDEARKRFIKRDLPLYDPSIYSRYQTKYFPAQEKYIKLINPINIADIIIR